MLIRDWILQELENAFSGLTIGSTTINVTKEQGSTKTNYLLVYLGDEENNLVRNDVEAEDGTLISYELILEVNRGSDYFTTQSEAIEKLKKYILIFRKSLDKKETNADFTVCIKDISYENIYAPSDNNDRTVLIMVQGKIIINQFYNK